MRYHTNLRRYRRNSDENLRRLERLARMGDPQAEAALRRQERRVGINALTDAELEASDRLWEQLSRYNDGWAGVGQHKSIIENLAKKTARHKYDPLKAEKLWKYWVDAQTKYPAGPSHGPLANWNRVFSNTVRKEVARRKARLVESQGLLGKNYHSGLRRYYRRSNPDADIRHLERIFQQEPTPENRNRLNAARNQYGLPPIEHEPAMQALLASGVKIRRVPGVQAQMALENLNLVKITAPSARLLFNAGIPLVMVGNQINSYHFFDNTRQAYHIDSGRWIGEGRTFESLVNEWGRGNHEQGKAAFFVNQSYYLLLERRT